jgi:Divergent InlB B-repeat domain
VGQPVGTLTSVPERIACGLACVHAVATFPNDTVVTLVAQAIPGATFSHWTGDCSGSGNPCSVTMDDDKTVVAHFMAHRSASEDRAGSAAQGLLHSRLAVPRGRGEVTVDGRTLSVAGGAEIAIALDPRSADVLVEGWVREGAGEGVWRFGFGPAAPAGPSIRNVLAGEPVTLTASTVVFRVKGKLPQKVAFVVRLRREDQ